MPNTLDAAEKSQLHPHPFTSVPVEVTVCVGRARPTISELLNLKQDAILTLDRALDDPVELFIGERLIARGVLEENESASSGALAIRLTEIIDTAPLST